MIIVNNESSTAGGGGGGGGANNSCTHRRLDFCERKDGFCLFSVQNTW